MKKGIVAIDNHIIRWARNQERTWFHASIAIVFIWFGILKVLGLSPAGGLVHALFEQTIPFLSFESFYLFFGWLEVIIGILFLIPQMDRVVIPILFLHMITTAGPLFFLPNETWQSFLVPTLVGQYIIKNIVIIAVAIGIAADLKPIQIKQHT
jgi:uncharacterized membrane protein YkgB